MSTAGFGWRANAEGRSDPQVREPFDGIASVSHFAQPAERSDTTGPIGTPPAEPLARKDRHEIRMCDRGLRASFLRAHMIGLAPGGVLGRSIYERS